jgi:hypothetical protein
MIGPLPARTHFSAVSAAPRHRQHVHAVDLDAGNAEAFAAAIELVLGDERLTLVPMAYWLFSITIDDRELPQLGHVEAFVDLALVRRAIAEIGQATPPSSLVLVAKARPVPSDTCAPTMPWPP